MKNKLKQLIIFIATISTFFVIAGIGLADSIENKEGYHLKVNNNSFTEFSDVLIPDDQKYFLDLHKIYFDNIDFNKLKLKTSNIITSKNLSEIKKELLRDAEIKKREESQEKEVFVEQKRIVNINLNSERDAQGINSSISTDLSKKTSIDDLQVLGKASRVDDPWHLVEIAAGYEKENKLNEAIKCYKNVLKTYPDRIEILYSYSLCLYKTKQYSNAEIILKKLISVDPNFTLAYYNLGNLYFKKGEFNGALNYFVKAYKQNPFSSDTCFNIALTLECLNQKVFATKYYLKCLNLNPTDDQAQIAMKRLKR